METLESALIHAADTLHEGLILTDEHLNIRFINQRARQLIGVLDEDSNCPPLNHYHKAFSKGLEVLKSGVSEKEYPVDFKGSTYNVSFYPYPDPKTGGGTLCILFNELKAHQSLIARESQEQFYYDVLDVVMNAINEWIVIVDKNGIITAMSRAYKDFVQDPTPEGKHVSEVIENTRMYHVIESGVPEANEMQTIRGNKMIASRFPIIQNGKVVGAVGKAIFKDIDDFYTLFNKLSKLQKKVQFHGEDLIQETTAKYFFDNIIGESPSTQAAVHMAQKASRTDSNVLIIGESGTGKELFSHAIHNASPRRSKPFIMLNCAAIPSELLESELFGYEQGAFTGANRNGKRGKFELADGGTIFLDEIGDMPTDMQAKLLRVLQEKEIDRIGGDAPIPVDVRVIAATNQNIESLVESGVFRKDLYYRLNVMRINLSPLRDRKEEIPDIADDILRKLTDRMGLVVYGFTPEAMQLLKNYNWPGNIRELENVLERALNLLDDDLYIKPELLPETLCGQTTLQKPEATRLNERTGTMEKDLILQALAETGGNKKKAAAQLGISRAGLYKKLDHYKIGS